MTIEDIEFQSLRQLMLDKIKYYENKLKDIELGIDKDSKSWNERLLNIHREEFKRLDLKRLDQ